MKIALAICGLVLFSCSPSHASIVTSPSPHVTALPTSSPSGVFPDLPVSKVDFSCRLPVATTTDSSGSFNFQGGFIAFPAARLADDPAGAMHYRNVETNFATTATPVLYGDGGYPFYDPARSRWVPAPARQASADGTTYAYIGYNSQTGANTAFVVDVATGTSRSFNVSSITFPQVADFAAAGVYIVSGSGLGGPGEGVWLLDPTTGAIKDLGPIHQVWAVRDGFAWVARLDPRDKTVWGPTELAPADSLVRLDLATGAETIWWYQAGQYPWLLGLDSTNRPVLLLGVSSTGSEIRLIDQPGSPGALVFAGNTSGLDYLQGDGDRLWFGQAHGIYLYRPGRGFQRVFAYAGDASTSNRIEPAGFCR